MVLKINRICMFDQITDRKVKAAQLKADIIDHRMKIDFPGDLRRMHAGDFSGCDEFIRHSPTAAF